jgi:hypothetical protein
MFLRAVDDLKTVFRLSDDNLLQIFSHFPVIDLQLPKILESDGFKVVWNRSVLPEYYGKRGQAFRAMSQTCWALRERLMSLSWERVETCIYSPYGPWYYIASQRLETVCRLLVLSPSLANHVR